MIPRTYGHVGKTIRFKGNAYDFGHAVRAIQFSLDDGESWTSYDVSGSSPDLWVHWTFSYTPERAGAYRLLVRCVTDDGRVSPLSDVAEFTAT